MKLPLLIALAVVQIHSASALELTQWISPKAAAISQPGSIQVYFSPRGGCTEAIVEALNRAKLTVFVQAYSFTSPRIAKALVDAKRRGVDVRVILDDSQQSERYTSADFIAHAGIPVWIDDNHSIAHNKVMVIDRRFVVTGSFNFTKAAEEKNAENLLIIDDTALSKAYSANWNAHLEHSAAYAGK